MVLFCRIQLDVEAREQCSVEAILQGTHGHVRTVAGGIDTVERRPTVEQVDTTLVAPGICR